MVTDFDRVQVEGPFVVIIEPATATTVKGSGTANALDAVTVTSIGKTLTIRPSKISWGERSKPDNSAVLLRITVPKLRAASLSGSGSMTVRGLRNLATELYLGGSGLLNISAIDSDRLSLSQTGSGRVTLAGRTATFIARISGTSALDASALKTSDVDVNAQTSDTVQVTAQRSAKVNATGTGSVVVTGKPACTVTNLGSGTVRCGS